jgi:hypothetical protein
MSLMKPGSKYVSLAAQQTAADAIAADTTKASLEYVNTQLGLKADSSALALKADSDTVTLALAGKVSTSTYTTGLGLKADLSYVDNQLALKVDLSTYTPALGAKADKTYVDTQIGLKASTDSVAAGLASKVDSSTLSSALALKADLVQISAIGSDNWLKLFAQDPESMLYGTLQRNQWLKTLKMYQSRNGGYPTMSTCLGEGYKYAANNQGNSGVGMCRQLTSTLGVVTDAPTVAALSKYSSTSQSPAMVSAVNGSSDWHRGVYYYINGTTATFNFVLDGKGASACPNPFANIALSQQIKATNGNIACTYLLGPVTGY